MFYTNEIDENLRLGDIIQGFTNVIPCINEPLTKDSHNYRLTIEIPKFLVVLTPCCSIENKYFTLAPLTKVTQSFFSNEYFVEDLTRINKLMPADKTVPKHVWDKLSSEERQKRLLNPLTYFANTIFIYEKNELLPDYEINSKSGSIKTGYYMVDFKSMYRVNCDVIDRNKKIPSGVKLLQLSALTRKELREKIAFYFSRIPEEDKILLET